VLEKIVPKKIVLDITLEGAENMGIGLLPLILKWKNGGSAAIELLNSECATRGPVCKCSCGERIRNIFIEKTQLPCALVSVVNDFELNRHE
jgi:hypothetical protein